MKAITLTIYGSPVKLTGCHKKVTRRLQPDYYVRVVARRVDVVEAMNKAKPLEGEILLNTVEVDFPGEGNPLRKHPL